MRNCASSPHASKCFAGNKACTLPAAGGALVGFGAELDLLVEVGLGAEVAAFEVEVAAWLVVGSFLAVEEDVVAGTLEAGARGLQRFVLFSADMRLASSP